MKKLTKPNYKKEVIKEIKNLRKHLTEEQKGWLDFKELNPQLSDSCIYGQVTGSCFSKEAYELIVACASPFYSYNALTKEEDLHPALQPQKARVGGNYGNFTFLEHYIVNSPQNNEHIINYIKGIDKRLELV